MGFTLSLVRKACLVANRTALVRYDLASWLLHIYSEISISLESQAGRKNSVGKVRKDEFLESGVIQRLGVVVLVS